MATELIRQLLLKGYNVTGTVRSLTDISKVSHLQKLGDALPGHLELREADLLVDGSFDDIVKGSTYVFHTAWGHQLWHCHACMGTLQWHPIQGLHA